MPRGLAPPRAPAPGDARAGAAAPDADGGGGGLTAEDLAEFAAEGGSRAPVRKSSVAQYNRIGNRWKRYAKERAASLARGRRLGRGHRLADLDITVEQFKDPLYSANTHRTTGAWAGTSSTRSSPTT